MRLTLLQLPSELIARNDVGNVNFLLSQRDRISIICGNKCIRSRQKNGNNKDIERECLPSRHDYCSSLVSHEVDSTMVSSWVWCSNETGLKLRRVTSL
jgi:hypothetical protein